MKILWLAFFMATARSIEIAIALKIASTIEIFFQLQTEFYTQINIFGK